MSEAERLRQIKTFPSLVKYLRDELEWPIESDEIEDITYDYEPDELGVDPKNAAAIKNIKQLMPLSSQQPWGIFFVNFEKKQLPIVALRRILRQLVLKNRSSANSSERPAWECHDLLFISAYGEDEHRQIRLAHFNEDTNGNSKNQATLKVLGWDEDDTKLSLSHKAGELKEKLRWQDDHEDIDQWRKTWSSLFVLENREVIRTSDKLAKKLATLASSIRGSVNQVLQIEPETGSIRKLMTQFQKSLIHDLTEDDFADMFAQTISYGLLYTAISRHVPGEGSVVDKNSVVDLILPSNIFLKQVMGIFFNIGTESTNLDYDELGINEMGVTHLPLRNFFSF